MVRHQSIERQEPAIGLDVIAPEDRACNPGDLRVVLLVGHSIPGYSLPLLPEWILHQIRARV